MSPAPVPPRFTADSDPGDEDEPVLQDFDVLCWRFDRLAASGYPTDIAVLLAERPDVDLHSACDLLEHGASLHEALRILT